MEKRVNLFVTQQGAKLKVSGQRLFVKKEENVLADVPIIHLRQIVVFGGATFTPRSVSLLLNEGVFITYLTRLGKFIGVLLPPAHGDGWTRKAQVLRSDDESFRIEFSREIVDAKISNSVWLLRKKRRNPVDLNRDVEELERMKNMLMRTQSIKELLGIEGSASRIYFSALGRVFNSVFAFEGRQKHPSTDPLNALLSLSYTLLHSICFSFLHVAGLDPYIGFYHEMRRGHASLASDLAEEFRAYLCDSFVLRLINQGYFDRESFVYTGERVFLTKEAMKVFLKEWAKKLDKPVEVEDSFKTTFWHLIELQAQKLKRSVVGNEKYIAFRPGGGK